SDAPASSTSLRQCSRSESAFARAARANSSSITASALTGAGGATGEPTAGASKLGTRRSGGGGGVKPGIAAGGGKAFWSKSGSVKTWLSGVGPAGGADADAAGAASGIVSLPGATGGGNCEKSTEGAASGGSTPVGGGSVPPAPGAPNGGAAGSVNGIS